MMPIFMRRAAALAALAAVAIATPALADKVDIAVDLSSQRMTVRHDGEVFNWPVSSGREGFETVNGSFGVEGLETMHLSKKYDNAPMPNTIFFHGGYAIHGTYEPGSLGRRPASHGCIRLSLANSARLFDWVSREGASIEVYGDSRLARSQPRPASRAVRRDAYADPDAEAYGTQPHAARWGTYVGEDAEGYGVRPPGGMARGPEGDYGYGGDGDYAQQRRPRRVPVPQGGYAYGGDEGYPRQQRARRVRVPDDSTVILYRSFPEAFPE